MCDKEDYLMAWKITEIKLETVSVSSRGAKPQERETGSLQVAYTMRLVLLNVSLHVLVIKSLQETQ